MFNLPIDPNVFKNMQGFNNSDLLKNIDQEQLDKVINSMGLNFDSLNVGDSMSNHGLNKVVNHFMVMARSGVLKQEEIQNFQCEPFEDDNEFGFKLVWRK